MLKKLNILKQKKIDNNNDSRVAYSWMWEFSKKVVIAIFLIYIFNYIICWTASFLCGVNNWNIPYIDTFITSTNDTTQIVLGGYFVKAMAENVIREKKAKSNKVNETNETDKADKK